MMELITDGTRELVGAGFTIDTDPENLVKLMIEEIENKRTALNI